MSEHASGNAWDNEFADLVLRIGARFTRVEHRRRARDYIRGLLGQVGRKNSWQLAEHAGHTTPDGLQRLLSRCRWDPDEIRDDLQAYVAERLGADGGVLIIDDTGFLKKGTTSAGVQRQILRHRWPHRELPDRRLRRLCHHPWARPGRP
ncbi:transposase [Streptomyces sp. NPDC058661]|uniref:transposase n=1 Tax=Streptomyces sp. NPDC058661 TaxID=3346582 RepID=UPI00364CF196